MLLQPLMGNLTGCDTRRISWTLELKTRRGRNPGLPGFLICSRNPGILLFTR